MDEAGFETDAKFYPVLVSGLLYPIPIIYGTAVLAGITGALKQNTSDNPTMLADLILVIILVQERKSH